MNAWKPTALALAIVAAWPVAAQAQSNKELLKELRELKARVNDLEKKLAEKEAVPPAPVVPPPPPVVQAPPPPPAGMTPDQLSEFNRIAVKTEALEDSRDALGFKGLKITGYADPVYIWNQRQHRAGFQFLNPVGDDGYNYDSSYFGAAGVDFQKETDSGTRWRLTIVPNRGTGSVFGDGSIVHEASVSIPTTDLQTRLIAGQLPDWSGYEYGNVPPYSNKLITHNLLFDFTLPTAYTGAGMEITRGKWISKVMLANLNASRRHENEKSPVLVYRVDYSKGEFQGFGFAGANGKIANFNVDPNTGVQSRDTWANLIEVDGYFIRGDWTVQGQASYGMQKKASITPDPDTGELRDARWWGLSGLAAYKFTPRLEGIVRADYLNNKKNGGGLLGYTGYYDPDNGVFGDYRNGIGVSPDGDLNKGANRYALSLGLGYAIDLNTTLKFEYRLDRASQAVFVDTRDGSFSKSNQLLGTSVLVQF